MDRVIVAMNPFMCAKDAFIEARSALITDQDRSKCAQIGFKRDGDESLGEQDELNSAQIEGKRPQDAFFDAESRVQRPEDGLSSAEGRVDETGSGCIGATGGLFSAEDEPNAAEDALATGEGASIEALGSVTGAVLVGIATEPDVNGATGVRRQGPRTGTDRLLSPPIELLGVLLGEFLQRLRRVRRRRAPLHARAEVLAAPRAASRAESRFARGSSAIRSRCSLASPANSMTVAHAPGLDPGRIWAHSDTTIMIFVRDLRWHRPR